MGIEAGQFTHDDVRMVWVKWKEPEKISDTSIGRFPVEHSVLWDFLRENCRVLQEYPEVHGTGVRLLIMKRELGTILEWLKKQGYEQNGAPH